MKLFKFLVLMSAVVLTSACQPSQNASTSKESSTDTKVEMAEDSSQLFPNALTMKEFKTDSTGEVVGQSVFEGKVVIDGNSINWLAEDEKEIATETKLTGCTLQSGRGVYYICQEINKKYGWVEPAGVSVDYENGYLGIFSIEASTLYVIMGGADQIEL